MPYVSFLESDFKPVSYPSIEDTPYASKDVTLSGNQTMLRVTGCPLFAYSQAGNNHEATLVPLVLVLSAPGMQEKYYDSTRCKDAFDITIPFGGQRVLTVGVAWKGSYTTYGPPEYKYNIGLRAPLEISIHEIGVSTK